MPKKKDLTTIKTATYSELEKIIKDYKDGYRRKVRPLVPREIVYHTKHFKWSDINNKFYDTSKPESRVESRFEMVLKKQGIDATKESYELIW